MLLGLREGLKGPTSIVVIVLVVGAMVLYGVDSLFTNSVAGNDVASVNGEDISRQELQRAMAQQKARLRTQFQLEPDADQLKDENLYQPTLESLVRRKALVQAAKDGGMGVSDKVITQEIVEAFSNEGEFNKELLDNYIYRFGYTPATFTREEASQFLIRQLAGGVSDTAFVTPQEVELLAAISGQKRSFYTITMPKSEVEKSVSVSDEEIKAFYEKNTQRYMEPEKVSVEYVEIKVSDFAEAQSVSEDDIRAEYELEVEGFNADPEYTIAHILLESEESQAKATELAEKLASGADFAELAKEYSDDLGSKNLGGSLGVMLEEGFEDAFNDAVYALAEGAVSSAVETDAGIHFIKLTKKAVPVAPAFEERKDAIANRLKTNLAADAFAEALERLDELTYEAENLTFAAEELGVSVKSSPYFPRHGGLGISTHRPVAAAAFADEVLLEGMNSKPIEINSEHAVVLRLKDRKEAHVKDLAAVKGSISAQLKRDKIKAELETNSATILARLQTGEKPEAIAKEFSYEFKEHKLVERTSLDVDRTVLREVYKIGRPAAEGEPVIKTVSLPVGDLAVVGLVEVQDGSLESLEEQQVEAMKAQLLRQVGSSEVDAFQNGVFSAARVAM